MRTMNVGSEAVLGWDITAFNTEVACVGT